MTVAGHSVALLLSTDGKLSGLLRGLLRQVLPSFSLRLAGGGESAETTRVKLIVADYGWATLPALTGRLTELRAQAPDAPLLAVLSGGWG